MAKAPTVLILMLAGCKLFLRRENFPWAQKLFLKTGLSSRVTRFGKFSPYGQLFSLGSFLKVTEVGQFCGLHFPR
jgi:hypothetical protein